MKCIKSKKNNSGKIILISVICIICITLGICIYILYNYNQAETEQKNSNYEKAISYYQKIEFLNKVKEQENECYYQKAIELRNEKNYDNSILYFEKINNYNDSQEQIKETKYQQALYNYNIGDFEKTKEILETMQEYKDAIKYLHNSEKMIKLQGTWEEDYLHCYVQIKGWNITEFESKYGYLVNIGKYALGNGTTNVDKVSFYDLHEVFLEIENNDLKAYYMENGEKKKYSDEEFYFDDENNNLYINKMEKNIKYKLIKRKYQITERKEPSIGMTKTEVENSTWGKPEKINRTKTSYGTHEQWCYSTHKYIYFEDGIVTSIQD